MMLVCGWSFINSFNLLSQFFITTHSCCGIKCQIIILIIKYWNTTLYVSVNVFKCFYSKCSLFWHHLLIWQCHGSTENYCRKIITMSHFFFLLLPNALWFLLQPTFPMRTTNKQTNKQTFDNNSKKTVFLSWTGSKVK